MKYECPTCHKEYQRKDFYKKHIILCDLLQDTKICKEELQDIPNSHEMYIMLQELACKLNKCTHECTMLRNRIKILEKKDKINSILPEEYLAQNKRCDINYDKWIDTFNITKNHILQFVDTNYINAICNIIKDNHNFNSPLAGFKYKNKNNIMIFNNTYWIDFTHKNIKILIDNFTQRILMNEHNISSENFSDIIKNITTKEINENTYELFYQTLFKKIKQNVKL